MRHAALTLLGILAAACSVGQGRGQMTGSVVDTTCDVDIPAYSLEPTFFAADVVEERNADEPRSRLTLRIQRGSYREGDSDGVLVFVRDANELHRSALGVPIPLDGSVDAPVQMTLYLNETCESGFPREFWQVPLVLAAQQGTITFDRIYAPDVDPQNTEITGRFEGVLFASDERPGERFAVMDGSFSFFFQRGRPAQPFP